MSSGPLVIFKSVDDMYVVERNGNKPNTVRLLTDREYVDRLDFARQCLVMGEEATIEIIRTDGSEPFYRRITDISQVGSLLGQTVWCISWKHEEGVGDYTDPETTDGETP